MASPFTLVSLMPAIDVRGHDPVAGRGGRRIDLGDDVIDGVTGIQRDVGGRRGAIETVNWSPSLATSTSGTAAPVVFSVWVSETSTGVVSAEPAEHEMLPDVTGRVDRVRHGL